MFAVDETYSKLVDGIPVHLALSAGETDFTIPLEVMTAWKTVFAKFVFAKIFLLTAFFFLY